MKKGAAVLRDPAKRRVRALMMLEYQIKHAATFDVLAKEFNVSKDTVQRTLSWAKKADLLVSLEDKILQELLPAAHNAIKLALEDPDNVQKAGRLGIEVFKGMVPGFSKAAVSDSSPSDPQGELARYVAQLRDAASVPAALDGVTLPALPPGETPADEGGDAESSEFASGDPTSPGKPPSVGENLDEGSPEHVEGSVTQ